MTVVLETLSVLFVVIIMFNVIFAENLKETVKGLHKTI